MQSNQQFGHAAYTRGHVGSADPLRLIVLLYEGAIRFTRLAQEKFDDPSARGQALGRAHRIVSELLEALDHGKGGDVAGNLDSLYRFALDELTRANVDCKVDALDGVLSVLNTLLSGWQEIQAPENVTR